MKVYEAWNKSSFQNGLRGFSGKATLYVLEFSVNEETASRVEVRIICCELRIKSQAPIYRKFQSIIPHPDNARESLQRTR